MRSIWRTHQIWRSRSGIGLALAPKAKVWVSPRPCRLCQYTAIDHGEEDQEVDEAGLVEVVEADDRLHDADDDAGDEGPRERHHARR